MFQTAVALVIKIASPRVRTVKYAQLKEICQQGFFAMAEPTKCCSFATDARRSLRESEKKRIEEKV